MITIEGRNPVLEAINSSRQISKIWLDYNLKGQSFASQITVLAGSKEIEIEYIDRQSLEKYSMTGHHQGIIAFAQSREYVTLEDILNIAEKKNETAFILVLDGIEDPRNFGAILRTAEAVGIHGVIIRERRAVGITPAVIKASAGAVEYVSVAMVSNIAQTIQTLKKHNIWVIGIDAAGRQDYRHVDFTLSTAIVIGGEGQGLSDLVKKRCDSLASIPMRGKISSLNASVAAAVVMYEVLRQKESQIT